jgi:exodeoxyribonuclease V beta subunit
MTDLTLDTHAVIEASAGTGKTYAIERLVLRLLTEKNVPLDAILVVTYTEKATAELKGRLRECLESALRERPEHRDKLQEALDGFDQARVFTIHGFCQRVLQEYAFENGEDFRPQLVSDPELLESCLRETQRKGWWKEYGELLTTILELSAYNTGKLGAEKWEQLARHLAGYFRPGCSHVFCPELMKNWPAILDELNEKIRPLRGRLRELAGLAEGGRVEEHIWYVGYGQLSFHKQWRESWRSKILLPLLEWLASPPAEDRPLASFCRLLARLGKVDVFTEQGFRVLTERPSAKAQEQLPKLCPGLAEAVTELEQQREHVPLSSLEKQLTLRTVDTLRKQLAAYKEERGLQSFEDMLTRVDAALADPENKLPARLLRDALRRRYRYAIVDEFQDTDPIQWRIFQRIFVEGAAAQRLMVVGDPKQAIFGFRGADVFTYLAAHEMLRTQYQATESPLKVNWRSSPELLGVLNHLFAQGHWFKDSEIKYLEVEAAPEEERPNRIVPGGDRTGRPALTLVDLTRPRRLAVARYQNAQFIAREIRRLLAGPALEFVVNQKKRALRADDMFILVFKRSEARPLLEALRGQGIPYTFYKEPGLWQSDEAVHLGYLLRAVARPGDRRAFRTALLTRFFRVRPEELAGAEELPPDHPARELFQRWQSLAEKRRWGELFQSFLEDTGVLFEADGGTVSDRSLANYRHLLRSLEQMAYGKDLDMLGIHEVFAEMQRRPGDQDADLKPVETEQQRVRILTVHASKGLQAPIVFLAGGFTRGQSPAVLTYHHNGTMVFDLCGGEEARRLHDAERLSEERRLLYVALTRAMFKLYVPRVAASESRLAGSLARILAPAIEQSCLEESASADVARIHPFTVTPTGRAALDPAPDSETEPPPALAKKLGEPAGELFPSVDASGQRGVLISSFSSLHRRQRPMDSPSYLERAPRADDDRQGALDEPDLLRGPAFGEMVHEVLAEIDFDEVGKTQLAGDLLREGTGSQTLIDAAVSRHLPQLYFRGSAEQLREACRQQVARLVRNGLHTPLSAVGGPLWRIPKQDRLHELEFHFPGMKGPLPPDVEREDLFLTGFMDLVFRSEDRYFLVDWKTNALPAYTRDGLERSMRDSDYLRQYRIYLQALERWLKWVHGPGFDFAQHCGGVYYLYLRGMDGTGEGGVFFHRPTAEDLRLESVLGD